MSGKSIGNGYRKPRVWIASDSHAYRYEQAAYASNASAHDECAAYEDAKSYFAAADALIAGYDRYSYSNLGETQGSEETGDSAPSVSTVVSIAAPSAPALPAEPAMPAQSVKMSSHSARKAKKCKSPQEVEPRGPHTSEESASQAAIVSPAVVPSGAAAPPVADVKIEAKAKDKGSCESKSLCFAAGKVADITSEAVVASAASTEAPSPAEAAAIVYIDRTQRVARGSKGNGSRKDKPSAGVPSPAVPSTATAQTPLAATAEVTQLVVATAPAKVVVAPTLAVAATLSAPVVATGRTNAPRAVESHASPATTDSKSAPAVAAPAPVPAPVLSTPTSSAPAVPVKAVEVAVSSTSASSGPACPRWRSVGPPFVAATSKRVSVGPPFVAATSKQVSVGPPFVAATSKQVSVGPPFVAATSKQVSVGPPFVAGSSGASAAGGSAPSSCVSAAADALVARLDSRTEGGDSTTHGDPARSPASGAVAVMPACVAANSSAATNRGEDVDIDGSPILACFPADAKSVRGAGRAEQERYIAAQLQSALADASEKASAAAEVAAAAAKASAAQAEAAKQAQDAHRRVAELLAASMAIATATVGAERQSFSPEAQDPQLLTAEEPLIASAPARSQAMSAPATPPPGSNPSSPAGNREGDQDDAAFVGPPAAHILITPAAEAVKRGEVEKPQALLELEAQLSAADAELVEATAAWANAAASTQGARMMATMVEREAVAALCMLPAAAWSLGDLHAAERVHCAKQTVALWEAAEAEALEYAHAASSRRDQLRAAVIVIDAELARARCVATGVPSLCGAGSAALKTAGCSEAQIAEYRAAAKARGWLQE